jgi:hypothetical protein
MSLKELTSTACFLLLTPVIHLRQCNSFSPHCH